MSTASSLPAYSYVPLSSLRLTPRTEQHHSSDVPQLDHLTLCITRILRDLSLTTASAWRCLRGHPDPDLYLLLPRIGRGDERLTHLRHHLSVRPSSPVSAPMFPLIRGLYSIRDALTSETSAIELNEPRNQGLVDYLNGYLLNIVNAIWQKRFLDDESAVSSLGISK